jgi:hypothetical protein
MVGGLGSLLGTIVIGSVIVIVESSVIGWVLRDSSGTLDSPLVCESVFWDSTTIYIKIGNNSILMVASVLSLEMAPLLLLVAILALIVVSVVLAFMIRIVVDFAVVRRIAVVFSLVRRVIVGTRVERAHRRNLGLIVAVLFHVLALVR